MTFDELQKKIGEYIHTEDAGMTRIALASIIATRMKLGNPIWMILIGPSSSGKSQILRPLALTDEKFIHRLDDMTESSLLSGVRVKKGDKDISLLKRIGALGIIIISDFTVIFSKNGETKQAILGQLRLVYDGEMIKYSGTTSEPVKWKGSIGILAGSTPSIYQHFEDVADMGERFIFYRMKDYDVEKATRLALDRKIFGKELDETLSSIYEQYIKEAVQGVGNEVVPSLPIEAHERILYISMFAAKLRTPVHYDKFSKAIDRMPVSEMPMRVVLQLRVIAQGLMIMNHHDTGVWELSEKDIGYIEWCAYSLANEERRACLKFLAQLEYDVYVKTQTIADTIGLSTAIIGINLQHLNAIGIVDRTGDSGSLSWRIKNQGVWELLRRLEDIGENENMSVGEERNMSVEESVEDGGDDLDSLF